MRAGDGPEGVATGTGRSAGFNEVIEDITENRGGDAADDGGYAQAARERQERNAEESKRQEEVVDEAEVQAMDFDEMFGELGAEG